LKDFTSASISTPQATALSAESLPSKMPKTASPRNLSITPRRLAHLHFWMGQSRTMKAILDWEGVVDRRR
jgi:hypothetical protein